MMMYARANKPLTVSDVELMFPYPIHDLVGMAMIKTPPANTSTETINTDTGIDNETNVEEEDRNNKTSSKGPENATPLDEEDGNKNIKNNNSIEENTPDLELVDRYVSGEDYVAIPEPAAPAFVENNVQTLDDAVDNKVEHIYDDESTVSEDCDFGFGYSPSNFNIQNRLKNSSDVVKSININKKIDTTKDVASKVTGKAPRQEIFDNAKAFEESQKNINSEGKKGQFCIDNCHLIYEEHIGYCNEGNRLYKKHCITCEKEITKQLFKEKNTVVYCSKLNDGVNELYKCSYVECLDCKTHREHGFDDDKPGRTTRSRRIAAV